MVKKGLIQVTTKYLNVLKVTPLNQCFAAASLFLAVPPPYIKASLLWNTPIICTQVNTIADVCLSQTYRFNFLNQAEFIYVLA